MQRQVSLNRLETDIETVGWMNLFLDRFWLIFEPVLSAQVIGQVDAILSENTPSFLDSIRMSSFTLGTKAPRVDGIKVYRDTAPDVVVRIISGPSLLIIDKLKLLFFFFSPSVWTGSFHLFLMMY